MGGDETMEQLLIYVAHPFGGLEENKKKVEEFIRKFNHYEGITFLSPIHNFGWSYEETEYEKGIDDCLALLEQCDVVTIPNFETIKNSKGCLIEYGFLKGNPQIDCVLWEELDGYLNGYFCEGDAE